MIAGSLIGPRGAVALVVLASSIAAASPREDARRHFDEGSRLYRAADYQAALGEFTAGYLAKPDPTFLFNIGQCDRMLGDLVSAKSHLKAYLEQLPNASNREAVKRFLAETEEAMAQQREPEKPKEKVPPPASSVELTQAPPTAPTGKSKPHRSLVLVVALVAAAVVVVGSAIAITLALVLPNDAAIPSTTAGNLAYQPR